MRAFKYLAVVPLWFVLVADASPTPTPPSPSPSPSQTPYIALDISAGTANTVMTISGHYFSPGLQLSLLWDNDRSKVLANTTTDSKGNFNGVRVKPYAGAALGPHHICASVNPFPCAQFQLRNQPTPTPTPKKSPVVTPSPSPSPSPTPSLIPLPAGNNTSGLDVMLRPPFIFLPLIALGALALAVAYWVLGRMPRPQRILPTASVVHRSARPTYGPINPAAAPPPPAEERPPEPPWAGPRES